MDGDEILTLYPILLKDLKMPSIWFYSSEENSHPHQALQWELNTSVPESGVGEGPWRPASSPHQAFSKWGNCRRRREAMGPKPHSAGTWIRAFQFPVWSSFHHTHHCGRVCFLFRPLGDFGRAGGLMWTGICLISPLIASASSPALADGGN